MLEAMSKRIPGETCSPDLALALERRSAALRREILKQKHLKY